MAPKTNNGGSNRNITDFFKRFTIPKNRRPANDEPEEEIALAAPRQGSRSPETQRPQGGGNSHDEEADTPQKPKTMTVEKSTQLQFSSSQLLSSTSDIHTLKRKRTAPRLPQSQSHSELDPSPCFQNISQLRNINPLNGAADVTPTIDSPFREATATLPRRVLLGSMSSSSSEAAPMSPEQMAASPISLPHLTRSANETSAIASFTSTSTLSTVPPSSQISSMPISSMPSSRRVVRGGFKVVTNSDSDDSDEELDDVSQFLLKRPELTPLAEPSRSAAGLSGLSDSQDKRTSGRKTSQRFLKEPFMSPPRTEFKNSRLAKLVAKNEERRLAHDRIKAMEREVEESKERETLADDQVSKAFDRDALLDLAVDDDQREELLVALERTEALRAANHYHFFVDDQPRWPASPFPVDSLPDQLWCGIYRDDRARAEACISGLAAELAERFPLPMNVTMWFASQLMHEPSEILCEAYVEILRVSSKHHHDTSMSDTIASLNSRYHTRSFFEHERRDQVGKRLPKGLQYVLRTLQFCAPASDAVVLDATPTTTCAAFLDLALLNIDVLVREDIKLSQVVNRCIQDMLEVLPETSFESLVGEVLGTLFVPTELPALIRCRAIANLPCNTPRAYSIRRRLALECFSTVMDRTLNGKQDWQASILNTLQTHNDLQISEEMDYDYLMAFIAVVDIAVAHGFTEYSDLQPPPTPTRATGSLALSRPQPLTDMERSHNNQIDRLVEQLQSMMSRVKDSGTSHLGRTQAKSLMEGLVIRLDACVRTRPRRKKGVFSRGLQSTFEMPAVAASSSKMLAGLRGKLLEVRKETDEIEMSPRSS